MVHVSVWRLRVGTFGISHVTFSVVKLYSGGGGDRVTLAVRDRPKHGLAVEAAARDLETNAKRWKEVSELLIHDVPSSRKDSQVLELFAQAMLLPSSFQMHGAGSSEMLCVSIPTGTKKKTNETVKAFELGKCAELDFDDEDVVDDE